jgi:hypothetical protein
MNNQREMNMPGKNQNVSGGTSQSQKVESPNKDLNKQTSTGSQNINQQSQPGSSFGSDENKKFDSTEKTGR